MRDQADAALPGPVIAVRRNGAVVVRLGLVLVAALLSLAALGPEIASAAPSRIQLGRFGQGGGGGQFGVQQGQLGDIAFNQKSKVLLAVYRPTENGPICIERLRLHMGLPAVPDPFSAFEEEGAEEPSLLCNPDFTSSGGTDIAVDNSGGPGQGNFYIAFGDPAGGNTATYNVFGFAPSGAPLGPPFPIPAAKRLGFAPEPVIAVDSEGHLWIRETKEPEPGVFKRLVTEYSAAGVPTGAAIETESSVRSLATDSNDNLYALFPTGTVRKYLAPTYATSEAVELGENSESPGPIAVDRATAHLLVGGHGTNQDPFGERVWVNEYDALGKELAPPASPFNALHLEDQESNSAWAGIAVDETDGIVYLADRAYNYVYAVSRFGNHPVPVTDQASEESNDSAQLNGDVDPSGEAATCEFQWGPTPALGNTLPCVTNPGSGKGPVAVSAVLTGLAPSSHYFYRLYARNSIGIVAASEVIEFGTLGPAGITNSLLEGSTSSEATLSATIDTVKQPTTYRVLYGHDESYGQATPDVHLAARKTPTRVSVTITGLEPETSYHFRFTAENSANEAEETVSEGLDATFATFPAPLALTACPNQQFRVGFSAALPDCRAYELVTHDLNGLIPTARFMGGGGGSAFGTELGSPAGTSLLFMTTGGALPGTEGNGLTDRYEAVRGASGWTVHPSGPTRSEADISFPGGAEPGHDYSFFRLLGGSLAVAGDFSTYLRLPDGSYRLLGEGSPENDLQADGKLITPGATHIIFSAKAQLTEESPPPGKEAVYDLTPQGLRLLSLPGETAKYAGAAADGSTVAYFIGSVLYVTANGETLPVSSGSPTFAGFSQDGSRLFHLKSKDLFAFETDGSGEIEVTEGDADPTVVNLAPDGSDAYFLSTKQLDGAKGKAGEPNLYAWDGAGIHFIGTVLVSDLSRTISSEGWNLGLARWVTDALAPVQNSNTGPANATSRSSDDAFLFESRARLTSYDNADPATGEPHREIYRYNSPTGEFSCLSCSPVGARARYDSELQRFEAGGFAAVSSSALIHNLSADGKRAFFETGDSLLPADADHGARDVYEWEAKAKGSCKSQFAAGGCLYLISSGQTPFGEALIDNYLYAASPSGDDVFLRTTDPLDPAAGKTGAPLLYDVRVGGGFPLRPVSPPCIGEACQGAATPPPSLPGPASSSLLGPPTAAPGPARCARGKRRVSRKGKSRCVKPHRAKRGHKRTHSNRRATR